MYESMKGKIVKVAMINNYVYHGRLMEEEPDFIIVEDILVGNVRVVKKNIEKVIKINNVILGLVMDRLTPKLSNAMINDEDKLQKDFDKIRERIKKEERKQGG